MVKISIVKSRRSHGAHGKATTTVRIDPSIQKALLLLQTVLKKPLNRLVNEALQSFIEKRTAEVNSDLQQILTRVRAYRRSDPKFDNAIAQFVDAEASLGSNDPVEGQRQPKAGPVQTKIEDLLRG